MDDFNLHVVAKKSIKGVFALVSRTLFIQILSFASYFLVLVPILGPEIIGIFTIASAVLVFFVYFQDIGLAASLIQKKEEPTVKDFQTVFTVQQCLVLMLVLPALFFSKAIADFYTLDEKGHFLIIALLISFFLTSLRTIPTVILERKLEFNKLVVPQVGEMLVFNIILVILALLGHGLWSFTIAVLARGIVGLVLTYIIQPWKIGFAFDKESFKKLVCFGLPFQTNSILALLKDDLLVMYIGKILPFAQVGYIGFSQKLAFTPLRLIMDNVIKITFPSYSRLQHNAAALRLAIEKSLFLISTFIFPTVIGMILLSRYLIEFVPKYEKWEPAIVLVSFFALNTVFSSISTPLTNFLNAIGKVKITLYFMIFWTIATWIFTIIFIKYFGFNGVAFASFAVSLSSIFVIMIARSYVHFSIVKPVLRQLMAALVMGGFILITRPIIQNLPLLVFEVFIAGLFYLLVLFILAKGEMLSTISYIIRTIRN